MSAFHFARLFKRSTGLSRHRFVVRRRIDRAKEPQSLFDGVPALDRGDADCRRSAARGLLC
jgi:hypothetical protein